DSGTERQNQVNLEFSSRFTELSGGEIEHVCIPNIKSFLLRSYLAILQGKLESAAVFLGIACNAAKLMGLHVDPDSLHNEPYMRQTSDNIDRGTTFWACFFIDRRLAIRQGRAVLMAACDVSVQSPVHNVERTLKERNDVIATAHDIYAYSFMCPASTEEAVSAGNLRYVSWLTALPASLRATNLPECPPSLISLHLCYHSGIILLHRPSLKQTSAESELANNRCLESASTITTLLKIYRERYADGIADFMVIHAAFTAALVHLVLPDHPEVSSYHKTIRALKSTMNSLTWMIPKSEYAKEVYTDLKHFAMSWSIKPSNSPMFWESSLCLDEGK
ncbi:zn 2cys6 transcription factor, partial [Colletotrichum asianum]